MKQNKTSVIITRECHEVIQRAKKFIRVGRFISEICPELQSHKQLSFISKDENHMTMRTYKRSNMIQRSLEYALDHMFTTFKE